MKTTGIGTTQHVQLPLSEVFVQPTGLREQTAGVKWSTRAEEQRALLDERLRSREISHAEFEALLDRLGLVEAARERTEPEPIAVNDLIRTVDYAVVLGDPGTGKTTLLRYLALRHAQALLNGVSMASAELGPVRLPLYVRAGDFARSSRREDGLRAFIAPFLSATLQCPVDCQRLDALVARALR